METRWNLNEQTKIHHWSAIKLVDDSTSLTKTLEVADTSLDNISKIYDRKNIIFLQYGTEWLIYKFNLIKVYF